MNKVKCIIDCETTGLNPVIHELIQLALIPISDKCEIVSQSFCIKVKALIPETTCEVAMQINQLCLHDGLSIEESKQTFFSWKKQNNIDIIIPIGFNYIFDQGFIDKWMKNCDLLYKEHFHYAYRDVFILANCINDTRIFHGNKPMFKKTSLTAICDELNIKYTNVHDALIDCYLTLEAYKKLMMIA